ncbi:MAG: Xaa-Pro peptidase family protein [Candidatus Hodarchaeaceae archaeon]|nr:Xaa-Pro peptidase family protein [Candidatus Hodarchaeaceae archaeon]
MRARIRKLRAELAARELEAYVAIQNARYLSGTSAVTATIISEQEPILICKRLEFDRARRESAFRDIRAYFPYEVPLRRGERVKFCELWQVLADCLRELGARRIGFDGMSSEFLRKLRGAYEADYQELPELVVNMRKIKSKQEIAWLRRSAALAMEGMQRAAELIEEGRSELEVAAEVEYIMRKQGSGGTPFSTIVASGRNSWLPHATATRKRFRRGELIIVDLGATYEGYASDMTKTFSIGPTRRQLKLMNAAKRAQSAAIDRIRDGVSAADVDRAARKVVCRAGLEKFFSHGTGHGLGLAIHEPPNLVPGSSDLLQRGMVVTVEPGVYAPGVGGARWEDIVLVTKDGHELLTQ